MLILGFIRREVDLLVLGIISLDDLNVDNFQVIVEKKVLILVSLDLNLVYFFVCVQQGKKLLVVLRRFI